MGDLIKNTRWGSPEGLYQDFAQNPSAFFRWGEFSEKMKMLNDPRFAGVIRAIQRGQKPRRPDSYVLRDVTTILFDCALRPEECFRLKWENFRDGLIVIHKGKGRGSRRTIPASRRIQGILDMRKGISTSEWIFPAPTKSGHIEASTLKKQHAGVLKISGVEPFVLYTLRHTCITRWAKYMDPFTLHVLAGHTDMNTTKRYVHPNETHIREAMAKVSRK